ncbi:hypothetical protein [Deinococcus aerophilus]|uniref:Lipoprotein n=1 Tax=Deinococcus aerophilus TaxID=522488 RepID=A0ABQ2H0I0_9DEIO|nr:hypothetical protein [Deinococcus aerophilus]GGM20861.1 hypothetical protein GCM10010841_31110 [Deinococcus aerophilus]
MTPVSVRRLSYSLIPLLLLSACTRPVQVSAQQSNEVRVYRYMARCVQSIERRRVQPGTSRPGLPAELHGQSCEGPVLGDYSVSRTSAAQAGVKNSVIRLDPSRLSGFTLEVESLDGQTLTYVDRGKTAAAAEQAGTFEIPPSAVPVDLDDTDHPLNAAELQEKP